MKKKVTLFILLSMVWMPVTLTAKEIGERQAHAVAEAFFKSNGQKSGATLCDKAVQTAVPFNGMYFFCGSDNNGFVIVSADDRVKPILGYSFDSPLNPDSMPPELVWWLQRYEGIIGRLRSDATLPSQPHPDWQHLSEGKGAKTPHNPVVGPLIQTHWDQGSSTYPTVNRYSPRNSSGSYAITGCVATAGAQIMKYWNYPEVGRGSASYVLNSSDFSNLPLSVVYDTPYDWANMPNTVYSNSTETQKNAVSLLMYHIGVGVHMLYGISASGASTSSSSSTGYTLEAVLRNYFKYSGTVSSIEQSQFEDGEWKALLRKELDEGRPMIYGGSGNYGGHAFVCDGYDDEGCFHFNWGWGGYADGYFEVGALNPGSYDFNEGCDVIIGIQPRKGNEVSEDGQTVVSVVPNNPAFGSTTGSGVYGNYTSVTISATPNAGYRFVRWSDNSRYERRSFLAVGGTQQLTAIFEEAGNDATIGPGANDIYGTFYAIWINSSSSWGIRIDPTTMAHTTQLEGVRIRPLVDGGSSSSPATVNMHIYSGGETPDDASATLVYSQNSITFQDKYSWYTLNLSNPIPVNTSQNLWIVFYPTHDIRLFHPASMESPAGSCWLNRNGYGWETVTDLYQIQGLFGLAPNPPVENLSASATNSLSISWNAPTSATPTSYDVAVGTTDENYLLDKTSTGSTSLTFTAAQLASLATISSDDLRRSTTYYIFVRANYTNTHGQEYRSGWQRTVLTHNFRSDGTVEVVAYAADEAAGYVTGSGFYTPNTYVTLEAIPFIGYEFLHWNDNNTQPVRTIAAPGSDVVYTANFKRTTHAVTVTFDASMGLVDVDGDLLTGSSTIDLPAYATVPFQAIPAEGYRFARWHDGNTTNPRFATITCPFSMEALFVNESSKGYTVYTEHRSINVQTVEDREIDVYDMLGRHIFSGHCDAATTVSLPVSMPGVYLLRIGEESEKIIVKN